MEKKGGKVNKEISLQKGGEMLQCNEMKRKTATH